MAMAKIDALLAEIASIKESLRIKNQSLANINPNYQMNQAYIAKLKAEVSVLNTNLATAQAALKAASTPPKVKPSTLPTSTKIQSTPYDDEGNLNPGWAINPDTNEPFYIGTTPIDTNTVAEDPYEASRLAAEQNFNDNISTSDNIIDDGSDPYVSNGVSTIPDPVLDTNTTVPDDADPYVLNGQSTIEPIQEQKIPDAIQGPAYDDNGNLMPGWSLDENNNPVWVGDNPDGTLFVEPATLASAEQSRTTAKGILDQLNKTRAGATSQDQANAYAQGDWRVRLSLAPGAKYLYAGPNPGILSPLIQTKGVLFPYTPSISVNYVAAYDGQDITHSNYKVFQYKGSSVDSITIGCDFTAQDAFEANYVLAVIHFFKSVTKMFYGQDQNPVNGTPPPLCYLTGMGAYQFDRHPLAITAFNYTLPTDVDYIQADNSAMVAGTNREQTGSNVTPRQGLTLAAGGVQPGTKWNTKPTGSIEPTYVPTKIQLSISAVPIVSRNDISNRFSLTEYGTGTLLRGSKNNGAGIW